MRSSRWLFLFIVVYVCLAAARAWADRPWCDEAWLASPAYNLIHKGYMGTTVLETEGTYLKGLTRYTYWIMPVYPVFLAAWFKIFGFGLFTLRMSSILFGSAVIVVWFWIVRKLIRNDAASLLTAGLLACDFVLVRGGAVGRMDMLCAALGFGGLAAYLALRERNINTAALAGHTLVATSVFTHPNGVMHFLGLMFLMLYLDWRRVRMPQLALGALPYLVLGACWGLYIAQAPDLFRAQFGGNASGRAGGLANPVLALKREIQEKYLGATTLSGMLPKAALMVFYAIAALGCLQIRELRDDRGVRALLVLSGIYFFYNVLFDGVKIYLYLVHVVPVYVALFAILSHWIWATQRIPRWATAAIAAVFVVVQLAGTAYTIVRNSYHKEYLPVVQYLQQADKSGAVVMGSAELAFWLGFDGRVLDDAALGQDSGKRADFIVVEPRYEQRIAGTPGRELLARRYAQVFESGSYHVYERRR